MPEGEPWTPEQALDAMRRVREALLRYREFDLAEEMRSLMTDVRTASTQVSRETLAMRREMVEASALNLAYEAVLGEKQEWERLFETGFHIEYRIPKPKRQRFRQQRRAA